MADISVDFAGVKLANPIILASGGPGWDGEHLKRCAKAGAGGLVPKSIGPPARWLQHPRTGRMALVKVGKTVIGMINLELFSTLPLEQWIEKELRIAAEGGAPIIASVVADPEPANTAKVAKQVVDTGYASMIEVNVSCPMPVEKVGMHIGRDPKLVAEQIKAVKEAISLPVSIKLSPNFAYIPELAKAAEQAGADAITATNSVQGLYGVDVETGKLVLPAFGGYSGPAIRPITLRCVAQAARATKIPVCGIGGISSWRDVVEYIMVGATTVQVCTAVMWRGLGVFKELADGLKSFMERKGYERIEDFRGIALKDLTTVEELAQRKPVHASVNEDLCTGCGVCERVCSYDAIKVVEGNAKANQELCDGCGLCKAWCPVEAIDLI
ncbi:MAG: 4Fe-4S binding protein [Candidatus Hadarchaeum sp.]|uniref:4Fe-4S binding protein n=1 Tax=Candidatus Hadarchaeum sp. TaxID=2883567 RepID=UPI00317E1DF9